MPRDRMKLAVLKCPVAAPQRGVEHGVHHHIDPATMVFADWQHRHQNAELCGPPQLMHFPQHHDHVFMYMFYVEHDAARGLSPALDLPADEDEDDDESDDSDDTDSDSEDE